ncbi:3-(3-hydroxy-phenyl)propionate hydroxylase [Pseudomonas sp. Tn43]|uniref:bifunctional 3-(3-hydroxy-phenyl)propionate/3-hydroxycinnamic acid hydroxylase n=1 Tax=Pseudomonas sp. Tn43 TaxID=701213 RepID=UPI00160BDFF7|nr:bifunctional 3-(3-hydroxy-phenyl)propionate/3-hydroxycinnamic acid hydroxylase [Pseudomonas sp. Tn43]MBB3240126.1 3-(3-hydroxy-phenyl)propionate hydroxylase [Pseudomonas sp. Tn43]
MHYDVVIVGMGPVGALCANLAGMWGLKALIIDKSEDVYANPRAIGFDHEVMRVLGNIHLADELADHIMPYRPSEYRTTGSHLIKRIDSSKPPHPLGWAPNYVFSQPPLEKALRSKLMHLEGVTVELGGEVLQVDDSDKLATLKIRSKDGREREVTTDYVLACDGGTSPIRMDRNLEMEDLDFDEPWLVVDVLLDEGAGQDLPQTNVQFCELSRPCTFVVGPGQHRRWEFMINPDELPAEVVKEEAIKKLLDRWLPDGGYKIWRASAYRFHALILKKWKVGNIFFLGDAAHMTPPFLAQGMCQGIRDALNLVWKLAFVKKGLASASLLDTYQAERIPHVQKTTLAAKEFGKVICERDSVRAAARDAELLKLMVENPGGTIRQSLIPGLTTGLISDEHSPAGELFPQPMVIDSTGSKALLDVFTGQSLRLVFAPGFEPSRVLKQMSESEAINRLPFKVVRLVTEAAKGLRTADDFQEVDGVLSSWMEARGCEVVVVRPDHYVYGGAVTAQGAVKLLESLANALTPAAASAEHPSKNLSCA